MRAGNSNRGWLQEGAIWGNMLSKQMLPGDEELGKKDDDHKPRSTPRTPAWPLYKSPLRWRRRRMVLAVVGLYLVYQLLRNLPALSRPEDLSSYGNGYGNWRGAGFSTQPDTSDQVSEIEPTGPPPGSKAPRRGEPIPHDFSGPIRFYRLATSLHGASYTNGYRSTNRNVLFAISSLQSAATLLPLICEMSRWSRNYVHVAFMGMEDIEVAEILEINGIDQTKCPAIWHDARPDYMEYSTDMRAQSSVMAAMAHIQSFLHPQVAIIDDALSEDDTFVAGMRAKTKILNIPLIEIPKDKGESLTWMTRLDASSLGHWHHATVDILIQVPPHSSSTIRLLKSVKAADYSGLNVPRLTIELPAEVDETVERYLQNFKWPPSSDKSQFAIRRRIANQRASQEESTIRFLELFYPTNAVKSHLLLLSPQAELSSQYYQYLMYSLLEYKHSSFARDDGNSIMGVTLELPSRLLDGKTKIFPPDVSEMHLTRYEELFPETKSVPFLWQAPNSHATLFFGDKWAEMHSFLTNRVAKHYESSKATPRNKLVSETLPSWMEYTLEFMRARGYSLIYPGATSAASLITVHNELYHAPEEFALPKPPDPEEEARTQPEITDEPFLRADEPAPAPKIPETNVISHSRPLHLVLPFDADLPEISHMPYLLYNGNIIPHENVTLAAAVYAEKFREVIGGCNIPAGKHRRVIPGSARDLFCFGTEDRSDWEDDVPEMFEAEVIDDYLNAKGSALRAASMVVSTSALASSLVLPTATSGPAS